MWNTERHDYITLLKDHRVSDSNKFIMGDNSEWSIPYQKMYDNLFTKEEQSLGDLK